MQSPPDNPRHVNDVEFQSVRRVAVDSIIPAEKLYRLYTAAKKVISLDGVWYECGVYRGGSASLLAETIRRSTKNIALHLFDTFTGIPFQGNLDLHIEGDFDDVAYESVAEKLRCYDNVHLHPGLIPTTFAGRQNDRVSLAHLDVDQERSTRDSLAFVWPRLIVGGTVIVDDYGWTMCPGVKAVIDNFLYRRATTFEVHPDCQIIIVKV